MKLPMKLPEPCPICGAAVYLTYVTEWKVDTGVILGMETECETEPDIDDDEWKSWDRWHYQHPYLTWMPYEKRMKSWLKQNYKYDHKTTELVEVIR